MKKSNVILITKKGIFKNIIDKIKVRNEDFPAAIEAVEELVSKSHTITHISDYSNTEEELYYWHDMEWNGEDIAISNFVSILDYIPTGSFWYNRQMGKFPNFIQKGNYKHDIDILIRKDKETLLYGKPIMEFFKEHEE